MPMGYGDIKAVRDLHAKGICLQHEPGLRTALVLVDDHGHVFTPTALYLEAEPHRRNAPNAMQLTSQQVREALARLSASGRRIALAQAKTDIER
jgi:hypothetical protein